MTAVAAVRRLSIAVLLTTAAFVAGVFFGWMLNENERP